MKKLLIILLLSLSLFACKEENDNEISKFFEQGYSIRATTNDGEKYFKCLISNDESNYAIIAKIGDKELKELEKLDIFSDTYETNQQDFVASLEDYEIKDLNDVIPSQEELDKLVGLSFGELEELGFENVGYIETDNMQFNFFFDNYQYEITVAMQEGVTIENMDDYSANDIKELKVGAVKYPTISSYILDSIN